jgi:hypothetical protein
MKTTTIIPRAVILSSENAAALAQYAKLIGWSVTELANHFLTEKIRWLTDENSGSAQEFLAEIYYSDRQSAERALEHVTGFVRKGHDDKAPKAYQWAIRQHQDGRFNLCPTQ